MDVDDFDRIIDNLRHECLVPEDLLTKLKEYRPIPAPGWKRQLEYLKTCGGPFAEKYIKKAK